MSLSFDDVRQIAHLARLSLNEAQLRRYQSQLSAILEYEARLNELDLEGIEPTTHAVPMSNVWRPDRAEGSLSSAELLANTKHSADNQFFIQTVLDQ